MRLPWRAAAMLMGGLGAAYIGLVPRGVIWVASTRLGFGSHSPGGLGVFDAAMLIALWQFDTEDLLAGLLLFRLLYYLVPFAISLAILGSREIWLSVRAARQGKYRDRNGNDRANPDEPPH